MPTSVVFVDSRVTGYQSVLDSLAEASEVFVLDGASDGLTQIATYLQGRTGIDAIHVISHGSPGALYLGSTVLDSSTLASYGAQLAGIGTSLTRTGDLLLYGCSVAKGDLGLQFITSLAQYTEADVAASTDLTGAVWLGGDWQLENSTGPIDSSSIFPASYQFTLLGESEPNNSRATANVVALNASVTGSLSTYADIDYYSVAATAAGTLSVIFDVPTNSSFSDYFKLSLYDGNGTLLSSFTTGMDKTYSVGVAAAGSYYIGVTSAGQFSYDSGQYSLTVSNVAGSTNGAESEANDTRATADTLTLGTAITGQLGSTSDVDYYALSISAVGNISLTLQTPTNSSSSFFNVSVYDTNGQAIDAHQTGSDSTWAVSAPSAGTYYVAVSKGTFFTSDQYSLTATSVASSGPVVKAQNQSVNSGAPIKAESLILSVTDPNNYAIVSYGFWDEGAAGGYLSFNGIKQAAGTWLTVSAADLPKVLYIGGSSAGSEKVDITAYDGHVWSTYASATVTTSTTNLPRLIVQNQSVNSGSSIFVTSLISSVSDPGNLAITSYSFWDEGTGGGYLSLNGVKQSSGAWITVSSANLAQLSYFGGSTAGSENVDIKVFDGQAWSDYQAATVTTKEVLPAILTLQSQTVDVNASIAISSVISSVRDPNNYAVTSYRFWDEGSAGGYLALNGVKQASATWVTLGYDRLSDLVYVGGSIAGSENVDVEAWNGFIWSSVLPATIITKAVQSVNPPVITVSNQSVNTNASIQSSSLILSVTDPNNYLITYYQFRDNGSGGGYFIYNGNRQASGTWIAVGASQLDKLLYVGGSAVGSETVDVAAFDDHSWSTFKTATISTTAIQYLAPVITAQNQTVNANAFIQAATLIASVIDPNNLVITSYGFWDEGSGGGYLSLDGTKQLSGQWIKVSPVDLPKLMFVGGAAAGIEKVDIVAWDGQVWSAYATSTVTTALVSLPSVVAQNKTVGSAISILASSLIASVSDASNLPIIAYSFRDEGAAGGYLSLSGVKQSSETWITVTAGDVQKLSYVGGSSSGSENIDVKVQNSNGWSNYAIATVLTQGAVAVNPVIGLMTDPAVKTDVTAAVADNAISYSEMLKILNDVETSGVTLAEFTDLKTLVSYFNKSGGITVTDYLYDISDNVVNGDAANKYWTGGALDKVDLGNLSAGSSQLQMDRLIQKWFLGGDLPAPIFDSGNGTYSNKSSYQLYGSGGNPLVSDIIQGYFGDCYLLASLVEIANCEPNVIKSMITDNGNDTYGVRFYINGKPIYITVNEFLPVNSSGNLLGNRSVNLWGDLIEKAYVQLNETPGALAQRTGNVYNYINGGVADPITEITGRSVTKFDHTYYTLAEWNNLKSKIVSAIQAGLEVDFGDTSPSTHRTYINNKVAFVGSHMFAGIGYNSSTDKFILHNPWGTYAGQTFNTEFEATMSELFSEHGILFVANGSLGGMAFSTSLTVQDTVAPVVVSFNPAPSTTNIAVGADIVLTFSEDIQRGVGNIVLKTSTGTMVASYDAASSQNLTIYGNVLIVNPAADLAFSSEYKVEFAAGSIQDLAGNSYAGTTSYNFTTQVSQTGPINTVTTGNNTLNGTAFADTLNPGTGADLVRAGAGNDTINLIADGIWSSNFGVANEGSPGSAGTGEVIMLGGKNSFADVLDGGADADTLQLTAGSDAFSLHDAYSAFNINVKLASDGRGNLSTARSIGIETILAGGGDDIVDLTSADYAIIGVLIDGGAGNDVLWGNGGDDRLVGGTGNDKLFGGGGGDTLNGGAGADVFQYTKGGSGADTIEDFSPGSDKIQLFGAVKVSEATVAMNGDHVRVSWGGQTIELIGLASTTGSDAWFEILSAG